MSYLDNKLQARRYFEEVVNQGNLALIEELFAPTHVCYDPARPEGTHGLDRLREHVQDLRHNFLDAHYTIDDQLAEGDKVVTRWTFHGTRKRDPRFMSALSHPVVMTGMTISRFVDGKAVESWIVYDRLMMMQQFGTVGLQAYVV